MEVRENEEVIHETGARKEDEVHDEGARKAQKKKGKAERGRK